MSARVFKPRTCVAIKQHNPNAENGLYTLYNEVGGSPFTTFCDFTSDPSFVWTLVGSLSFNEARKKENRVGFYYNAPINECFATNISNFRLPKSRMEGIYQAPTTNYVRATCNFDFEESQAGYKECIRFLTCPYSILQSSLSYCIKADYIKIFNYSCRGCYLYLSGGRTSHPFFWTHYCSRKSPDLLKVMPKNGNLQYFGNYATFSSKFSCTNKPDSLTNWWFGGTYL